MPTFKRLRDIEFDHIAVRTAERMKITEKGTEVISSSLSNSIY